MSKKQSKKAKKIKLLKVLKIEQDKHIVELEIEGAPEPPEAVLPTEPLEIHAPEVQQNSLVAWWKSLW